ncbi:deoxycytidylate deaminase-like isoform X1 [Thunnus albacares]|uniref:deoxycytidylate deaminase-like isoform X1 n=2 Tax=Thunnus TaxID=8234 RepID=UPI001CF63871|nr:deoxycytidylate deaminase-like isoform X1 [Thunnus albacares]
MERNRQQLQSGPSHGAEILDCSDYFMAVAALTAKRSKDPSTKVGACIVNRENKIVSTGHNKMPNGCDDKLPWAREGDKLKTKYPYVCHAELNAFMNKTSADVRGCTIYVTLFPCNECTKLIIQGGIEKVVYLSDKHHGDEMTVASKTMLDLAEIPYEQFNPRGTGIIDVDISETD